MASSFVFLKGFLCAQTCVCASVCVSMYIPYLFFGSIIFFHLFCPIEVCFILLYLISLLFFDVFWFFLGKKRKDMDSDKRKGRLNLRGIGEEEIATMIYWLKKFVFNKIKIKDIGEHIVL